MGMVIAIVNPKGGVGKTTTALNLAASLAAIQRPTLLIDMDPDGACEVGLGFGRPAVHGGLFDVFAGRATLPATIHQTSLPYLHLVPNNIRTSEEEMQYAESATDRRLMRDLLDGGAKESYEFIILDCPPTLANLTVNALVAADTTIIPVNPGQFTVKAIVRLVRLIRLMRDKKINEHLTVAGFVITMFDARTRMSPQIERDMRGMFKHLVLATMIPMNARVNEANYRGEPVVTYDPQCAGAQAYMNMTLELLHRLGFTPKRRGSVALGAEALA